MVQIGQPNSVHSRFHRQIQTKVDSGEDDEKNSRIFGIIEAKKLKLKKG